MNPTAWFAIAAVAVGSAALFLWLDRDLRGFLPRFGRGMAMDCFAVAAVLAGFDQALLAVLAGVAGGTLFLARRIQGLRRDP